MGLFRKKTREEKKVRDDNGSMEYQTCEESMTKYDNSSVGFYDEDDEEDDDEELSVLDAAYIWLSNGKDEDYTFGYTEEELEEALR